MHQACPLKIEFATFKIQYITKVGNFASALSIDIDMLLFCLENILPSITSRLTASWLDHALHFHIRQSLAFELDFLRNWFYRQRSKAVAIVRERSSTSY